MATSVKLKVRKLTSVSPETEAQAVKEAVYAVMQAIQDGEFDAHLDVLFKAIDDRIRDYQEEEGDGELPTRDRADKLRPITVVREAIIPVEGTHYRMRGSRYQGVTVLFLETAPQNEKGAAMAKVQAIAGNEKVVAGNYYNVPVLALEEIPEIRNSNFPEAKVYGHAKCHQCGRSIQYSGRGRPKKLCANCEAGNKKYS